MIVKFLEKYIPGRGQVFDAATGKPVQDVARPFSLHRFLALFMFLFALAVSLLPVLRRTLGLALILAAAALFLDFGTLHVCAQTDMSGAVDAMTTLWNAIEIVAIGVVIFVVGRKLFRKI